MKAIHVAAVLAVLGGGILLGKAAGRNEDLWKHPPAPDTGAGWAVPAGTFDLNDPNPAVLLAARESQGASAIAEAKKYYRLIVHGPAEVITEESFQCANPYRVHAMILYVIAVAAPQATTYPIPIDSTGDYFLATPDMASVTTEFVQGASTYCSVQVRMGVLNQRTGVWASRPPVTEHTLTYEIVRTDGGGVRTHYLQDAGTRFN